MLRRALGGARGLHVAIVGSGPGGFYTADRLFKDRPSAKVDMYERFPVPFGLVRFGVAPDHPEVKICTNKFETVAQNPNFTFLGNVHVGRDVTATELHRHYDAVVFAYGAEGDRVLGIPGEENEDLEKTRRSCPGAYSARSFVGWYNGHPDHVDLNPNLDAEKVVVVGQGNVALDVARILLSPVDELAKTDLTKHALDKLATSRVREVVLLGRRGPVQAAFTIKEFRELTTLRNCQLAYADRGEVLRLIDSTRAVWSKDRPRKRMMELIEKSGVDASEPLPSPDAKRCTLKFLRSPLRINRDQDGKVVSLMLGKNHLNEKGAAVPSEEEEAEECQLILRSIGYRSLPLEGVPFDVEQGLIPNSGGRVCTSSSLKEVVPGLYASGWVRRGPTGVIVSTMMDAYDTATSILKDLEKGDITESPDKTGHQAIVPLLLGRNVTPVSFEQWKEIDRREVEEGQKRGAPREKMVRIPEMLDAIAKGQPLR